MVTVVVGSRPDVSQAVALPPHTDRGQGAQEARGDHHYDHLVRAKRGQE